MTERAAQLDADAARVRAKLAKAPRVQNANPLGTVLEQMIGATAAALTAWQQAIVAGVFELCLVGVMVIYELLGDTRLVPRQMPLESPDTSSVSHAVWSTPDTPPPGHSSPRPARTSRPRAAKVA